MVIVNSGEKEFYMDGKLHRQIETLLKPALKQHDEDFVLIVDGAERVGKSVFAMQIAKYVDPTLDLSRICFTPDEFRNAIINATKGQAVIFDEAYRGFSAKGALTEINKILVSLMMEMGQKNLFVIIVLPTFYLLEKYVALWRARGVFHCYRNKTRKGFWVFFNAHKKKQLFLKGKLTYSYQFIKSRFKGRFTNKYMVDEQAYRLKKASSLKEGYKNTRQENFMHQRDKVIYAFREELGFKLMDMVRVCQQYDIPLKKAQLSVIFRKFEENGSSLSKNSPETPTLEVMPPQ